MAGGGMHGEMQGKYYRYCSRSIRYSTDLNSENNKFDMETFDLVSEYCNTQGENIENGVNFKFILVSTAPRIDFHMKTEV